MKIKLFLLILCPVIFVFFFSGCASLNKKTSAVNRKNSPEYVFIVILDAVRYNDTFGDKRHLYIENTWTSLRPLGTICTELYNTGPTFSIPSHISLLTGKYQKTQNPEDESIRPLYPTVFEYYSKTKGLRKVDCLYAASRPKFEIVSFSSHAEYGIKYSPDFMAGPEKKQENENVVYEQFVPYVKQNHPLLNILTLTSGDQISKHLKADDCVTSVNGAVDACGGSAPLNAYYESIIMMDNMIFDLWNRIQEDESYKDKTALIVLSSHGRHTNDYSCWGDDCKGCTRLVMLALGPGIRKDFVSSKKRKLIDLCPTVGALLGFPAQYSDGKIMEEIFEK